MSLGSPFGATALDPDSGFSIRFVVGGFSCPQTSHPMGEQIQMVTNARRQTIEVCMSFPDALSRVGHSENQTHTKPYPPCGGG